MGTKKVLNYSTSIDFHKTTAEISKLLSQANAQAVSFEYHNQIPINVRFSYRYFYNDLVIKMPVKIDAIMQRLKETKSLPSRLITKEQAARIAWRTILIWLKAQLDLVENDQITIPEIFLSYVETKDGDTVFEKLLGANTDDASTKSNKAQRLIQG